jgi:hypothetical protein
MTPQQEAASRMTPQQEAVFEAKAEKHFRSHRELPVGRNFRCWNRNADPIGDANFRKHYDEIFKVTSPSQA